MASSIIFSTIKLLYSTPSAMKTLVLFSFMVQGITSLRNKEVDKLVIEEENDSARTAKAIGVKPRGQDLLCSSGSDCIPLSNCKVMAQLMEKSCLQTSKLRQLTCGYRDSEPMVCCPTYCPAKTSQGSDGECGIPREIGRNWGWNDPNESRLGSQPWAVRVGFKNKNSRQLTHLCVGSIISRRVVLTAAHCALAKSSAYKIASVRIGEYDATTNPDCNSAFCAEPYKDIALSHIIVHPSYDDKTFRHNIALLILKEAINYTNTAQPICIPSDNQGSAFVGLRPTLIGWGKMSNQYDASTRQQQVEMPVLPRERCETIYGSSVPITSDILCVGGEGKDACSGFGGAPLVALEPSLRDRYYQIGLVSFGADKCGEVGVPSVYTRIDCYTEWIITNSPRDGTKKSR